MTVVLIRVDANSSIGVGHMMRCIAVADALGSLGANPLFVTRSSLVAKTVSDSGYQYVLIDRVGDDIDCEIGPTERLVRSIGADARALLVDTYEVTPAYVKALSTLLPIAYLGSKRLVAPELSAIINYSSSIDVAFYDVNYPQAIKCLGVAYAPIRSCFWTRKRAVSPQQARVLLMSGGADAAGMLRALAEAFSRYNFPKERPRLTVVVGSANQHGDELEGRFAKQEGIEVLRAVEDMVNLMDASTLAVTAGGTTTYELCARRLPFVVYSLVAEQDRDSRSLDDLGIAPYAGSVEAEGAEVVAARACRMAAELLEDNTQLRHLSDRMRSLVSEDGAVVIADMLMSLGRG